LTAVLGLVLTRAAADGVHGRADVGPRHHQETGIVHGGWYAAVVETVGSIGAHHARPGPDVAVVGVSNYTEFFRPHREGRLDIHAVPVHVGRTQQVWEVRMSRTSDDKLVARGQLRMQHVDASR
jgi:uncharacterized protein (TIGR00369 family)